MCIQNDVQYDVMWNDLKCHLNSSAIYAHSLSRIASTTPDLRLPTQQ